MTYEVSFPKDKGEKLTDKDGSLTIRYKQDGKIVEDHHRAGEGSPLRCRDIYLGEGLDRSDRESIFFEGTTGKEKPYLRRVYHDNRLSLEQGLRGALDKIIYEDQYTYRGNESRPSSCIRSEFDQEGNTISIVTDIDGKVTKKDLLDTLGKGERSTTPKGNGR